MAFWPLPYYAEIPDYGGTPEERAANQERVADENIEIAHSSPDFVPQSYLHPGSGNLPIIGWTVQNSTGSPFRPYAPTGQTPDWTGDTNSLSAGRWDQNETGPPNIPNTLNRAPIGGAVYDGLGGGGDISAPTHLPEDVGGQLEGTEEY